jgi:hypothetical protein
LALDPWASGQPHYLFSIALLDNFLKEKGNTKGLLNLFRISYEKEDDFKPHQENITAR